MSGLGTKNNIYKIKIIVAIIAGFAYLSPYIVSNYFVFIFLVPILYIIYKKYNLKSLHIFLFTILLSTTALFPIVFYNERAYLFGILVSFSFMSLFLFLSRRLITVFNENIFSIFVPAVVWLVLLFLLNYRSMAAAVFDVGVLVPSKAPLIWYLGSSGLTTLIVLFNSAFAHCLARKKISSLAIACFIPFILFTSHAFLLISRPLESYTDRGSLKLALIQGDIPSKTIFGYKENLDERIKRYIKLSEEAVRQGCDLIVWPEYTLPIDLVNRFPEKMGSIITEIKKSERPFIVGSMLQDLSGGGYNYNAALVFNKDGAVDNIYYSQDPAVFNRNIQPKSNSEKLYIDNSGITLCWEEINAKIFRDYVKNGAEYFISLSSNTDLDYSYFKRYASFFSRARAAENMRYLARATQTGITQIIDPYGQIAAKIPEDKSTYLIGEIYKLNRKTFYSIHGDILAKAFILVMAIIGLMDWLMGKQAKQNE